MSDVSAPVARFVLLEVGSARLGEAQLGAEGRRCRRQARVFVHSLAAPAAALWNFNAVLAKIESWV